MRHRRPGLQDRWSYVVNSLQRIVPSYESASRKISLYSDRRMRDEVIRFGVKAGWLVLDLGSGPGTLSALAENAGGEPVLVDVSARMLRASKHPDRVQAAFESLPFRREAFDAVVSGFAVRDSFDLADTLGQVQSVLRPGGRFAFCDLGKPDSPLMAAFLALYIAVVPKVVGLTSSGRPGLGYGSLLDTYLLVLTNSELQLLLSRFFEEVAVHGAQFGGSIVVTSVKAR